MAIIVFISTILCMMVSLVFFPKIKIFKTSINTHWLIVLVGAIFMLIFISQKYIKSQKFLLVTNKQVTNF